MVGVRIPLSKETIRSFIAVEIGSQIIDQISAFQKSLVDTGANLKLVETKNVHITMRFLGELPVSLVNRIGVELKNVPFKPFTMSLQGTGVFPNMRRINVVWVGLKKGIMELEDIHSQIESGLKRVGIRSDDEAFSPHITVARVRSAHNKDKLVKFLFSVRNKYFGSLSMDSVKLKKSVLTPKGPIYTTMVEVRAIKNSL